MRQLCLIIPLLTIPKFIFAADGLDGCHIITGVTNQSRLYHTPYTFGAGSPTQWIETSEGHGGWNALNATRCFNTTNIPCEVYIYGSTAVMPASTSVIYSGYYAVITTNCPIDDYVPVFFIFTAGIACISIIEGIKVLMKVSLITVVYNGEAFLEDCITSVIAQDYSDIEYIVIDGASTDNTPNIVEKYRNRIHKFISEPDEGLYDAINKGIDLATGEIVGLLNADDMLADKTIISKLVVLFKNDAELQAIYGDLNYVHPVSQAIIRKWKSKQATKKDLLNGWMPAHPTLYIKRTTFAKYGNYALDLGTAADYDLMLRYLYVHSIKTEYLPLLMVNMRMGGVSNGTFKGLLLAAKNDFIALKRNMLPYPLLVLIKKKMNKLEQFFHKKDR